MEPHIQYAASADGVRIAFSVFGQGPPLIIPPALTASHLQMEWEMPDRRAAFERFAERVRVVRYDPRGVGMSERDVMDFSLEACTRDLEAVIEHIGLERFALYGRLQMGDLPLAYAARHPERVSHLILWRPVPADQTPSARLMDYSLRLVDQEWELFTQVFSRLATGWDSSDATPLAMLFRASQTPASFRAAYDAVVSSSLLSYAKEVRVPTLIVHPLRDKTTGVYAMRLASEIANAQVAGIPGDVPHGFPNAVGIAAIQDFMNAGPAHGQPLELDTSAFRTVLFTDIVEHTEMMQRLGDERGRDVLREHEHVTRDALRTHGGTEVKTVGDSHRAVECAIALQQTFASREVGGERIHIRVGLNAGEPIAENDDLFGSSVILAARAKEQARGGEVLATDVVRQLLAGRAFFFAEREAVSIKGFEEPLHLYEVRWQD
jgi:pimeloyl-ACP methyl ester carboxylesterase